MQCITKVSYDNLGSSGCQVSSLAGTSVVWLLSGHYANHSLSSSAEAAGWSSKDALGTEALPHATTWGRTPIFLRNNWHRTKCHLGPMALLCQHNFSLHFFHRSYCFNYGKEKQNKEKRTILITLNKRNDIRSFLSNKPMIMWITKQKFMTINDLSLWLTKEFCS